MFSMAGIKLQGNLVVGVIRLFGLRGILIGLFSYARYGHGLISCRWRWLDEKYIALKINTSNPQKSAASKTELDIFRHINEANPRHQGWSFIRHLLDSFIIEHDSPEKRHLGLVFEPLREPLWIYKKRFRDDVIPSALLKVLLRMILKGLDYLHSECRIIHTGLFPLLYPFLFY